MVKLEFNYMTSRSIEAIMQLYSSLVNENLKELKERYSLMFMGRDSEHAVCPIDDILQADLEWDPETYRRLLKDYSEEMVNCYIHDNDKIIVEKIIIAIETCHAHFIYPEKIEIFYNIDPTSQTWRIINKTLENYFIILEVRRDKELCAAVITREGWDRKMGDDEGVEVCDQTDSVEGEVERVQRGVVEDPDGEMEWPPETDQDMTT